MLLVSAYGRSRPRLSARERMIRMKQMRVVTRVERIGFPIIIGILVNLLLPPVAPLITMLMLGNLFKEVLVTDRLAKTAANEVMNIVIVVLTIAIGSTMGADRFLTVSTIEILLLNPDAVVFHPQSPLRAIDLSPYFDSRFLAGIHKLDRVAQQVGNHLGE